MFIFCRLSYLVIELRGYIDSDILIVNVVCVFVFVSVVLNGRIEVE